jgi:hypothetical protein
MRSFCALLVLGILDILDRMLLLRFEVVELFFNGYLKIDVTSFFPAFFLMMGGFIRGSLNE